MTLSRRWLGRVTLVGIRVTAVLLVAFLLAIFPLILRLHDGELTVTLGPAVDALANYLRGLADGTSFQFNTGYRVRDLTAEGPQMLLTSLAYAAVPGVLAVLVALPLGSVLGRSRREWVRDVVTALGFAPDFMIILGLQLGVVWITRHTGHRLAQVATLSPDDPAVLLPVISMVIVPAAYLARLISVKVQDFSGEEFLQLAKAKGLPRWRVHWVHVMPNVLVAARSNLHKLTAVLLTELFIVEYLFSLPGITAFVLSRGGDGGYQFPLVMNAFLGLSLIYLVTYRLLLGVVLLAEGLIRRA